MRSWYPQCAVKPRLDPVPPLLLIQFPKDSRRESLKHQFVGDMQRKAIMLDHARRGTSPKMLWHCSHVLFLKRVLSVALMKQTSVGMGMGYRVQTPRSTWFQRPQSHPFWILRCLCLRLILSASQTDPPLFQTEQLQGVQTDIQLPLQSVDSSAQTVPTPTSNVNTQTAPSLPLSDLGTQTDRMIFNNSDTQTTPTLPKSD